MKFSFLLDYLLKIGIIWVSAFVIVFSLHLQYFPLFFFLFSIVFFIIFVYPSIILSLIFSGMYSLDCYVGNPEKVWLCLPSLKFKRVYFAIAVTKILLTWFPSVASNSKTEPFGMTLAFVHFTKNCFVTVWLTWFCLNLSYLWF